MKRKAIVTLAVAIALLVAIIPVSAGSSSDYGTYGGSYYEVSATCNSESYSASTYCESTTYKVRADAALYRYMGQGEDAMYQSTIYSDKSHTRSASVSGTTYYQLAYLVSYHYVNGVQVRSLLAHGKQFQQQPLTVMVAIMATITNWSQLAAEMTFISVPPVKVARTQRRYLPIFIAIAVVSGIQLWGQSLQNQVSR